MQRVMDIPIWCILQMTDIPVGILTDQDGKEMLRQIEDGSIGAVIVKRI